MALTDIDLTPIDPPDWDDRGDDAKLLRLGKLCVSYFVSQDGPCFSIADVLLWKRIPLCSRCAHRYIEPLALEWLAEQSGGDREAEAEWEERERALAARAEHSVVYFVERLDGLVKIGFSTDWASRRKSLEREFGELNLLGTIRGHRETERAMHRRFHHLRVKGEWFLAGADLREFIGAVVEKQEARSESVPDLS